MAEVTVGYWDCRGLGHPIILMLEYIQKPYQFKTPDKSLIGPPPKYDKSGWLATKGQLLDGFDFPNLPYYHDPQNGIKLTQSNAIILHIARYRYL